MTGRGEVWIAPESYMPPGRMQLALFGPDLGERDLPTLRALFELQG